MLADPPGVCIAKSNDSRTTSKVRVHTPHAALSKSANAAIYVGGQLLQQQYSFYLQ